MMESCEAHELMAHPISCYLVKQKFQNFGIYVFSIVMLVYVAYLSILTTIALRAADPATLYNQTSFSNFDDSYCYNVSQAISNGLSGGNGIKTTTDYILKYILYVLVWFLVLKNIVIIILIIQISFSKTWNFLIEIPAEILSFVFIFDQSYQMNLTFRCPYQWQYGAFALMLSWFCLLNYLVFMPIIGIYILMLQAIFKKFMKFFILLVIIITSFALTYHMLFSNFDVFSNTGLSFVKTRTFV